jgi:hypothetical protein
MWQCGMTQNKASWSMQQSDSRDSGLGKASCDTNPTLETPAIEDIWQKSVYVHTGDLEREESYKSAWCETGKLIVQTPEITLRSPNTPPSLSSLEEERRLNWLHSRGSIQLDYLQVDWQSWTLGEGGKRGEIICLEEHFFYMKLFALLLRCGDFFICLFVFPFSVYSNWAILILHPYFPLSSTFPPSLSL